MMVCPFHRVNILRTRENICGDAQLGVLFGGKQLQAFRFRMSDQIKPSLMSEYFVSNLLRQDCSFAARAHLTSLLRGRRCCRRRHVRRAEAAGVRIVVAAHLA